MPAPAPPHVVEVHRFVRQRERHDLVEAQAHHDLAKIGLHAGGGVTLPDRHRLGKRGRYVAVAVADSDILEDVVGVHDVRTVPRNRNLDCITIIIRERRSPKTHPPEALHDLALAQVKSKQGVCVRCGYPADARIEIRRDECRLWHSYLHRLDRSAAFGKRGRNDVQCDMYGFVCSGNLDEQVLGVVSHTTQRPVDDRRE